MAFAYSRYARSNYVNYIRTSLLDSLIARSDGVSLNAPGRKLQNDAQSAIVARDITVTYANRRQRERQSSRA